MLSIKYYLLCYLGGFESRYNDFGSRFSGSNFASGEGSNFVGGRGRVIRGRGGPVRGISARGPGNASRGGRGAFGGRGGRGRY